MPNETDKWKTQPGRHGNVFVAPDSCDPFPPDFWSVPTTEEIIEQQRVANLPIERVVKLLGSLGADGAKLTRLF